VVGRDLRVYEGPEIDAMASPSIWLKEKRLVVPRAMPHLDWKLEGTY